MPLIDDSAIVIRDRQRTSFPTTPLNELKMSIEQRGLLHAPTFFPMPEGKWLLIAGERRLRCIRALQEEGKEFMWNKLPVPVGKIPAGATHLSSEVDHKQLEFDENHVREDLTWQEKAKALADIHSLLQENIPGHTVAATGRAIEERGGMGLTDRKGAGDIAKEVRAAVRVSEQLSDPKIAKARNLKEAEALILKGEEEKLRGLIAKRQTASLTTERLVEVRLGSLLDLLPTLDDNYVDLILTDPPYGIDAGSGGFRGRTVHHHNYDDSVENAREVMQAILTEGFRICKQRANLFMFTDIKHWDWLQTAAGRIGWTPFRTPMIWQKSQSEGLAPWGGQGPRRTYDVIMYMTRGQKGLLSSPVDILYHKRVPKDERTHAAEKPVDLLKVLIECSTLPGDFVLDPCCGSGSTLVAAKQLQRRGLGIERDETYHTTAVANIHKE